MVLKCYVYITYIYIYICILSVILFIISQNYIYIYTLYTTHYSQICPFVKHCDLQIQPQSNCFDIDIDETQKISQIKKSIHDLYPCYGNVNDMELIKLATILKNGKQAQDYCIQSGDTLHLVVEAQKRGKCDCGDDQGDDILDELQ